MFLWWILEIIWLICQFFSYGFLLRKLVVLVFPSVIRRVHRICIEKCLSRAEEQSSHQEVLFLENGQFSFVSVAFVQECSSLIGKRFKAYALLFFEF